MRVTVTVLGCGTSAGVPQIGCTCPVCTSTDPRNRRLRASILVEAEGRRVLVDTGPDLREQCLRAGIGAIDALFYTHAHADHIHGLDDLRQINNVIGAPIPTYLHETVLERIRSRFPYSLRGRAERFRLLAPRPRRPHLRGAVRGGRASLRPLSPKARSRRELGLSPRPLRLRHRRRRPGRRGALPSRRRRRLDRRRPARQAPPLARPPGPRARVDRPRQAPPRLPHPHEPRGRLRRLGRAAAGRRRPCVRRADGRGGGVTAKSARPRQERPIRPPPTPPAACAGTPAPPPPPAPSPRSPP